MVEVGEEEWLMEDAKAEILEDVRMVGLVMVKVAAEV
jgi:hypothetical protein